MKSIIITLIASLMTLTSLRGQWKIVNEGLDNRLNVSVSTLDFINNDIWRIRGWGRNSIYKTIDGGQNWIVLIENSDWKFDRIEFLNDSIGWANGEHTLSGYQYILKTLDGGQNWIEQKAMDYGINNFFIVTENVVYASAGGLLKTSNGGLTWVDIAPVINAEDRYYSSVFFLNPDTGIVFGRYSFDNDSVNRIIHRTFDGGETWDNIVIPEFYNIFNIEFIDDSTVSFLANTSEIWPLYDNTIICKTTDLFSTWSVIRENNYPVHSIHFFNNDVVLSIMDDSITCNIMKSYDGGLTWEKVPVCLHGRAIIYYEIYFVTGNIGYIVGHARRSEANVIMKSVDQGNNWTYLDLDYPFSDVYYINRNKGVLVGGGFNRHDDFGSIFITNDGGKTWDAVFNGYNRLTHCLFTNNSNGFVISNVTNANESKLYQTLNGGESWFENDFDITDEIKDIFFVNEYIGYVATNDSIYKTMDGGESWDIDYIKKNYNINSIFFIDENTGWVVGDGGFILKHSAPATWEEVASGTDLPLRKVFFSDRLTGWIAGGFNSDDEGLHPILLKTENGGKSWTKIKNVNYLINDFCFLDKNHGFAVGEDKDGYGIVLETNNGSNNWTVEFDSLSAPLNAIHFKDGYGWAVGENGLILKTIDSTYTSISEHEIKGASNSIELQNYPNPFSSATVISYQLPVISDVELSVYDLLGHKVAVLANERHQPGSYKVQWNASGMKSGLYWCELKTGQTRMVMKMILLK